MSGNDSSDELESTNSNSSDPSSSSYSPVFHVQEQLTSDKESDKESGKDQIWVKMMRVRMSGRMIKMRVHMKERYLPKKEYEEL